MGARCRFGDCTAAVSLRASPPGKLFLSGAAIPVARRQLSAEAIAEFRGAPPDTHKK
jgi:hypothetical protein